MRGMLSRAFVVAALLTGCATADRATDHNATLVDAADPTSVDSRTPIPVDGHTTTTADAPPTGCTPMQTDLLANGGMDASPTGNGWTAAPIDPTYPIIAPQMPAGYSPNTTPNVAWMGGFAQAGATDTMYQDVTVPASTTSLVLTGSYMVLTSETGTTAKDKATVELRTTTGTTIEAVLSLDNRSTATSWTPLNHSFANPSVGQTVRLYFTSSNNTTLVTDFFYDSLQLVATHCD